ncbi:MAG TPA: glycosyltransferase [Candidatus Krumholzibacteria bacterium]|nr:glycosyltransferase [Candidatus Krumholzibacteria bacterium]
MTASPPARPLRILYVIDALARGGTELQLTGLVDHLDRDLARPHLLTLRPSPPELTPADCPHWALDVPRLASPGGLAAIAAVARRLRRERFDVVQTFFQDATVFGAAAARLAGVPVRLGSFRDLGFWRSRSQDWLMRRSYPMLTGFVANAQVVRDHFAAHDGLDPARIAVIPNGVDTAALPWVDHAGPTTDIGLVGNFNRRVKRTDLFVRAAGMVAREHPEVRWHLLGDGQLRGEIERLAADCGLGDRMVFAGRIADVPGYLERLQVGVLCSDSEGFSNALLEYMFKGCAAVATNVGGNAEALAHGRTGLLVRPDDPAALAAALALLVRDTGQRRKLAQAARAEAEATYGWERCVAAYMKLYGAGR